MKKNIKNRTTKKPVIPTQEVAQKIHLIRGQKVMLDSDLAELYEVQTGVLNQAVKRNIERFPDDFMFQLTPEEHESLRSQIVTLKEKRGQHRKYLPYAFTEQGVAMLSSVLRSDRAVQVNIAIMRAFVQMRKLASTQKVLLRKVEDLERVAIAHDSKIEEIFDALKSFVADSKKPSRKIGFKRK